MEPKGTANGHGMEPWRHLGHKIEQVGASIQRLASRESLDELRETLDVSRRVDKHPYGMVAMALGAGYLLGGGLFSSTTRRMLGAGLNIGLRVAAIPLLKEQLTVLMSDANRRGARNPTGSEPGGQS